jgi:hypothetical protein
MPIDVHYTMQVEDLVICLVDVGTGVSITNAAERVILDLARMFSAGSFAGMRVIYRDTTGIWDGLAHRSGRFISFVALQTHDRNRAIAMAKVAIDRDGKDWPR